MNDETQQTQDDELVLEPLVLPAPCGCASSYSGDVVARMLVAAVAVGFAAGCVYAWRRRPVDELNNEHCVFHHHRFYFDR